MAMTVTIDSFADGGAQLSCLRSCNVQAKQVERVTLKVLSAVQVIVVAA